jgi:hypothetical protein
MPADSPAVVSAVEETNWTTKQRAKLTTYDDTVVQTFSAVIIAAYWPTFNTAILVPHLAANVKTNRTTVSAAVQ